MEVWDGSRLLLIPGLRQRALLAALLLRPNEVVPVETLTWALWGDEPPDTADNALRVHVSTLRKLLHSGHSPDDSEFPIVTKRPGYLLQADPASIDAHRFEELLSKGHRLLQRRDARNALAALDQAIDMWRGDALADLPKGSYAKAEVHRLEELRLGALEARFEAQLALGRHDQLIGDMEAFIAAHPLRERARGHLMVALYRADRQSEALDLYQGARSVLREGLGLDPSPFLKSLQRAILTQDPVLDWRPPYVHDERKPISLLSVDLMAFAGAREAVDPEEAEERLLPFHARVREEIERFGGTPERHPGDMVLGVFGVPTLHEDDPERSVLAALRVVEAVDELNAGPSNPGLAVRIGVATGEALVREASSSQGDHLVGDVVNSATRLHRFAPEGGIVVGEATYRATTDRFEYQRMGSVLLGGSLRPIWRVKEARSRFGTGWGRPTTPFVGRKRELDILEHAYQSVLSERCARLITLTGEPGIGKSRLIGEFFRFIDSRPELVFWRQGTCLPFGQGSSFSVLSEILKAQAGILESDDPDDAARKLQAAVRDAIDDPADRDWSARALEALVGVTTPDARDAGRDEILAAWRRFVEGMAQRDPVVLVFEDLHWADEVLLNFLKDLASGSRGAPILVIVSARPEFLEVQTGWPSVPNSSHVPLRPMPENEIAQLVSALLPERDVPEETLSAVAARSAGYPLYAEQVVRMLKDQGMTAGGLPLPETIHGLLGARLDALPPVWKELLQNAAVVGRVFWGGAVASLAGIDEAAAKASLDHLAELELIRPVRMSSVRGQPEYAFWHGLLQEVAYGHIPRAARTVKHRAVAEWLERLAGDRIADRAELVAHHYLLALGYTRSSPGQVGLEELAERARRHLVTAGDWAMRMNVAQAEAHFQRALDLCPPGDPDRPQLLHSTALATYQAGELEAAEARFAMAIEAFRAVGNRVGEGSALLGLGNVLWARGETARRTETLHQAVEVLQSEQPSPQLADAYSGIAFDLASSGAPRKALAWCNKALGLAETLGLSDQRMRAIGHRGLARCYLGDQGGVADIRDALQYALQRGLGREPAVIYNNLAEVLWPIEGPARAIELYRQGAAFAERRGISNDAMGIRVSMLGPLFEVGRWDELLELTDGLAEWAKAEGSDYDWVETLRHRAHVLACRGDVSAAALASDLLPVARAIGDPVSLTGVLAVCAFTQAAAADPAGAVPFLEEVAEVTRGDPALYRAHHLPEMVRLAVAAGDPGLARRLLHGIRPTAPLHRHAVQAAQATLAEERGRHREAARRYGSAAVAWKRYGFVREHAMALLGEGRCLDRLREPGAQERIREATALLGSLGSEEPTLPS